jgi:hypothetical protein
VLPTRCDASALRFNRRVWSVSCGSSSQWRRHASWRSSQAGSQLPSHSRCRLWMRSPLSIHSRLLPLLRARWATYASHLFCRPRCGHSLALHPHLPFWLTDCELASLSAPSLGCSKRSPQRRRSCSVKPCACAESSRHILARCQRRCSCWHAAVRWTLALSRAPASSRLR